MATSILTKNGLKKFVTFPESCQSRERRVVEFPEEVLGLESIAYADYLFPRIDPSFLGMKHEQRLEGEIRCSSDRIIDRILPFRMALPRFAVYKVDSPVCQLDLTIGATYLNGDNEIKIVEIKTPFELPNCLFDNLTRPIIDNVGIWDRTIGNRAYTLISLFNGTLPAPSKEKINACRKVFGDGVYIVAEAKKWQIKRAPLKPAPVIDPLILGVINNECYLLDQFDCTPMEDYVKREFRD